MTDHVVRDSGARLLRLLGGTVLALLVAAGTVIAAIISFDANPVGPVFVALATIVGGALLGRRTHDPLLKGIAYGLVLGGLLAVLLWPLFEVDSGGSIESGL
jgi:hypothetical protein